MSINAESMTDQNFLAHKISQTVPENVPHDVPSPRRSGHRLAIPDPATRTPGWLRSSPLTPSTPNSYTETSMVPHSESRLEIRAPYREIFLYPINNGLGKILPIKKMPEMPSGHKLPYSTISLSENQTGKLSLREIRQANCH
jgi:hypothetical protein